MNNDIIKDLSKELSLKPTQVEKVLQLLQEGATVPFIARYRKEMTGSLNEDQIKAIEKQHKYLANLQKRKEEVIKLIDEKGMLTDVLRAEITSATKLQTVEDLYLPFKEKRKTKATEAIKKGLEPLADFIETYPAGSGVISAKALEFINDEVLTAGQAIEGALHIIAEKISDNANHRELLRKEAARSGVIKVKAKRKIEELDVAKKYEMYYDFAQSVRTLQSYRVLAFNRGEAQKMLNVKLEINNEFMVDKLQELVIKNPKSEAADYVSTAIEDSLKRLLLPSIEREIRTMLTEKAQDQAIKLFSDNLDKLIMQPPLQDKVILGVDPAFRTGCKLAVINEFGQMMKVDVIYPHPGIGEKPNETKVKAAVEKLNKLIQEFKVEQIVIGNGTASRETEKFLKDNIKNLPIHIISEAGASVYSASKIAKDEFPTLQVEERSAVSIARRIQDPMAELVKIDPKAIGVGQYQHDVNQTLLSENLDFVMIKNINKVGVNLNTASVELLKYVSGLDRAIAKNIVAYREENTKFSTRSELKKVKRLGEKTFEQCAGFLKIENGKELLDSTFIHPENYKLAKLILKDLGFKSADLGSEQLIAALKDIDKAALSVKYDVNLVVIQDIISSFEQPSFDIRENFKAMEFDKDVVSINDLKIGMKIKGQVRNIVEFGAFVDIGIKNDGLCHISELSTSYVKNVADIVAIGDVFEFQIKSIDEEKGKVQLTLKGI